MSHAIIKLSEHSSLYRGFTITKNRKVVHTARYQVSQGDQSYGKFDAQAQATDYIDWLCNQKAPQTINSVTIYVNRMPTDKELNEYRRLQGE